METAVHTYAFRALPLEAALDEVVTLGCERAEVWLGHAVAEPGRVRPALAARELQLAAVSIGGVYRAGTPLLDRLGDLLAELRAPRVVTCVAPGLLAHVRAAIPSEIEILVENHWDQPLAEPGEVLAELRGVPNAGACVDTGHAALAGWPPARFVAQLGPVVRHVHLKDARLPPFWQRTLGRRVRRRLLPRPVPTPPGEGALDVPALLAALRRSGFAGTLSVELEGEPARDALAGLLAAVAASSSSSASVPARKRPR